MLSEVYSAYAEHCTRIAWALPVTGKDVFTLDLVGACVEKLGLYDSSLYYY